MPNGTYGGVRRTEMKVGQKIFVSQSTRYSHCKMCFCQTLALLLPGIKHLARGNLFFRFHRYRERRRLYQDVLYRLQNDFPGHFQTQH